MRHLGAIAGEARSKFVRPIGVVVILGLLAGGCSTLPSAGPTAAQIRRAYTKDNGTGFTIVEVDPALIAAEAAKPPIGPPVINFSSEGRTDTLGPGDVLGIDIYEVGVTLFSRGIAQGGAASTFTPSATSTNLPTVIVDTDGYIQLPYIGRINVLGKTPGDLNRAIERAMVGLSQRPQALVTVKQNAFNVYYVSGDVRSPGRFELGLPRQRLLDALARAGGTVNPPDDMTVRMTRAGSAFEARLSTIDAAGAENILLLPGDRVELFNRPRTFLTFGATDKVAQLPFSAAQVSLAEALARIGGPSERSADPKAIYVFRWPLPAPSMTPVAPIIYRLNMTRADSYFLSQRFAMQDKDVIYIATASSNAPAKLTQIISQLFSPIAIARSLSN